ISPATKLDVCQPPYENITAVIAAPMPGKASTVAAGVGDAGEGDANHNPAKISAAMAPILSTISALCALLPERTPRQLIKLRMASTRTAIQPSGTPTLRTS